jgi:hypothetical protein
MKAFEFVADLDEQHHVQLTLPASVQPGKVRVIVLAAEAEEAEIDILSEDETQTGKQPQVLYGAWKDKFPEDIDLDGILGEIRGEWMKEWGHSDTNA